MKKKEQKEKQRVQNRIQELKDIQNVIKQKADVKRESKEDIRKAVVCECDVIAIEHHWSFYNKIDYIIYRLAKGKTTEEAVNIINNTF